MKTTVEIPDELFRRAKAKAALEGIPLRDLMVHGLQLALHERSTQQSRERRAQFPLIRSKPGAEPLTAEQVTAELETMADEESAHSASFM
jgi:hypothetical protein